MLGAIVFAEYARVLLDSPWKSEQYIALSLVYFGAFLYCYLTRSLTLSFAKWLLVLAHLQALVAFSRIADLVSLAQSNFVTSGLWAVFALVVLGSGYRIRDTELARSALMIFGLVAAKVFFYDIQESGSVARILSLVVVGAALYAGGYLWRQVSSWAKSE